MQNNIKISVVLPCLNEEKTLKSVIEKCFKAFKELNINGEVIVSDNGSKDNSVQIAKKNCAKVVFCKQKGYGITLQEGFKFANGKYIVMADADDTYNLNDIPIFYKKIIEEQADMVIGSRLKGKIEKHAMPILNRYVGTPLLTGLINFLYKTNISDINCGMRIFKAETYKNIIFQSSGMEFASELFIKFKLSNCKIVEIPTSLFPSVKGRKPHLNIIRDGFRHLYLILNIYFKTKCKQL